MRSALGSNFRLIFACVLSLTATVLFTNAALGNVLLEFGLDGGYTDNLLSDSSRISDRYSNSTLNCRWYPTERIEVGLSGDATFYDNNPGLSSRLARLAVSVIPTREFSGFAVYGNVSLDGRRYREEYSRYNNNGFDARLAMDYGIGSASSVRVGLRMQGTEYLGSSNADKLTTEAYTGANLSLPERTTLDIEFGFGSTNYRFIDGALEFIDFENPEGSLLDGKLRSFFVSPRISHSLGELTGVNIVFTHRQLIDNDDELVFGSSVGFLSPWTSIWEGNSVTLGIKSYIIPKCISAVGVGYWNRKHLRTLENDVFPIVIGRNRQDEEIRSYVRFDRPILVQSVLMQPYIHFDFSNNKSTNELFDYSSFSASIGLNLRM